MRSCPSTATWLRSECGVSALPIRDLDLHGADDPTIFSAARASGAVVFTKDSDFAYLVERHGPPPQVVWLTCGNTSNAHLHGLLSKAWPEVRRLLEAGEGLIEISDVRR